MVVCIYLCELCVHVYIAWLGVCVCVCVCVSTTPPVLPHHAAITNMVYQVIVNR